MMRVYLYRCNPVRYVRLGEVDASGRKFQVVFTLTQGVGNMRRPGVHLMPVTTADLEIGAIPDRDALVLLGANDCIRPFSDYASPLHYDFGEVSAVVTRATDALCEALPPMYARA